MDQRSPVGLMDRIRFIGYGILVGIVIGAVIGWMFHAWVGFLFKLFIVFIFMIPLIAAIYFWRRVTTTPPPARTTVRDADWIEIEAGGRSRR